MSSSTVSTQAVYPGKARCSNSGIEVVLDEVGSETVCAFSKLHEKQREAASVGGLIVYLHRRRTSCRFLNSRVMTMSETLSRPGVAGDGILLGPGC